MADKNSRFGLFDSVILLIFIGAFIALIFWNPKPFLLSLILVIVTILMLMILGGRLVAPFYIEGRIIRLLLANEGKIPLEKYKKFFREYSDVQERILKRLEDRACIEVADEIVILKKDNYEKGIRNSLMMWSARREK